MEGSLLGAVRDFFEDSKARGKKDREESEVYKISMGVRLGCVMMVGLFSVCMVNGVEEEESSGMVRYGE